MWLLHWEREKDHKNLSTLVVSEHLTLLMKLNPCANKMQEVKVAQVPSSSTWTHRAQEVWGCVALQHLDGNVAELWGGLDQPWQSTTSRSLTEKPKR